MDFCSSQRPLFPGVVTAETESRHYWSNPTGNRARVHQSSAEPPLTPAFASATASASALHASIINMRLHTTPLDEPQLGQAHRSRPTDVHPPPSLPPYPPSPLLTSCEPPVTTASACRLV